MNRVCSDCKEEFPATKEYFNLRSNGKPKAYCKPCDNTRTRAYFRKMKEERPEQYRKKLDQGNKWKTDNAKTYGRKHDLKKNYGITIEQYDEMLEAQSGVCAICQNQCSTGRRLAVDHCHEIGEIRGLLCSNCNQGIGKFKDSIKLLEAAIKYLESK